MRVLLDEHLPVDLATRLKGHNVSTVRAQGWIGMKNGELLGTAAASGLSLAVVILDAPSNKIRDLVKRLPATLKAIEDTTPGEFRHVAG